ADLGPCGSGLGEVTRPRSVLMTARSESSSTRVSAFQSLTSSTSKPRDGCRTTKSGCRERGPTGTSYQHTYSSSSLSSSRDEKRRSPGVMRDRQVLRPGISVAIGFPNPWSACGQASAESAAASNRHRCSGSRDSPGSAAPSARGRGRHVRGEPRTPTGALDPSAKGAKAQKGSGSILKDSSILSSAQDKEGRCGA